MKKIYGVCVMNIISLLSMENQTIINFSSDLHSSFLYSPLMQVLYNETYSFLKDERFDQSLIAPIQNKNKEVQKNIELTNLIKTLNSAQHSNITEDDMALFAYNTLEGMNGYYNQLCVPLFFSCLKRYNLTTKETRECLPDIANLRKNFCYQELSQAISSTQPINIQSKQSINTRFSIKSLLKQYPAYLTFLDTIIKLIHEQRFDIHKDFLSYVYTNKETSFKNYYSDDYNNITRDFYFHMNDIFHDKKLDISVPHTFLMQILDILRSIAHAKALRDITNEQHLGQEIINLELPQSMITSIFSYFRPKNGVHNADSRLMKNRISLFCLMLKKYNLLSNNKQTPHPLHYFYYQIKNDLQLALPDNYTNTVFDERIYAFIELDQLVNDFQTLVCADDESIEQLINEHYSWGK